MRKFFLFPVCLFLLFLVSCDVSKDAHLPDESSSDLVFRATGRDSTEVDSCDDCRCSINILSEPSNHVQYQLWSSFCPGDEFALNPSYFFNFLNQYRPTCETYVDPSKITFGPSTGIYPFNCETCEPQDIDIFFSSQVCPCPDTIMPDTCGTRMDSIVFTISCGPTGSVPPGCQQSPTPVPIKLYSNTSPWNTGTARIRINKGKGLSGCPCLVEVLRIDNYNAGFIPAPSGGIEAP